MTLPFELVMQIVRYLPINPDLQSLLLVSKLFHAVLTVVADSHVKFATLSHSSDNKGTFLATLKDWRLLPSRYRSSVFLYVISTRPELTSYTKKRNIPLVTVRYMKLMKKYGLELPKDLYKIAYLLSCCFGEYSMMSEFKPEADLSSEQLSLGYRLAASYTASTNGILTSASISEFSTRVVKVFHILTYKHPKNHPHFHEPPWTRFLEVKELTESQIREVLVAYHPGYYISTMVGNAAKRGFLNVYSALMQFCLEFKICQYPTFVNGACRQLYHTDCLDYILENAPLWGTNQFEWGNHCFGQAAKNGNALLLKWLFEQKRHGRILLNDEFVFDCLRYTKPRFENVLVDAILEEKWDMPRRVLEICFRLTFFFGSIPVLQKYLECQAVAVDYVNDLIHDAAGSNDLAKISILKTYCLESNDKDYTNSKEDTGADELPNEDIQRVDSFEETAREVAEQFGLNCKIHPEGEEGQDGQHQPGQDGADQVAGQMEGLAVKDGEEGEDTRPVPKTIVDSTLLDFVKGPVGGVEGDQDGDPNNPNQGGLNPQFTGFGEEFGKLPAQPEGGQNSGGGQGSC
ncbi:hypothetical protein BDR26DRAFT_251513 [Obelidium mucronatum]|nr:hypothetical protein BDR26DRAFT_251513 [Obelidium mucronatum]